MNTSSITMLMVCVLSLTFLFGCLKFIMLSFSSYKGHRLCWHSHSRLRGTSTPIQPFWMGCQVMDGSLTIHHNIKFFIEVMNCIITRVNYRYFFFSALWTMCATKAPSQQRKSSDDSSICHCSDNIQPLSTAVVKILSISSWEKWRIKENTFSCQPSNSLPLTSPQPGISIPLWAYLAYLEEGVRWYL